MISKKIIKIMHYEELYLEYMPKFDEKEELVFINDKFEVIYHDKKETLQKSDIFKIEKDLIYKKRLSNTIEGAKKALFNEDNPKYRLYFAKPEDDVEISYDEAINILQSHTEKVKSFEYIAYKNEV